MQRCNLRIAPFHNSREGFVPESSRPELAKKNRCSCSALAALQKIQKWDQKADENYAKTHGGRKSPVKEANKCWEAVINLNDRHTLKDVKKLVKKLEQITGYRAAQIALHKDEGHLDEESGNFVLNIHAHVIFYARDVKTGLSLSTANYGRKDLMRQMQDAVAEELGMERGRPVEETGKKHLSPRAYKAQKRQEAAINANNKEYEQKLAEKDKEWQEKLAQNNKEWERKQAEREARQAEWERKLPEIMARKEQYSKFIIDKIDWEAAKTGKKLAYEMEMLGLNFAGVSNPQGNLFLEAQKDAIRNIFKMLGATAQLAVFLLNKTLANDEKIKSDAKIYNVESTLLRAVDYVANSDPANAEELKIRIRRTFLTIPEDKRRELFEYAIENAPTKELQNDIRALIEGRFEDIARTEAAQKRIENRDLRQSLREYSEEIRKIRDEIKAMDEENRILNLAERALLKDRGAGRSEYAEQEADNKARQEEIKGLKDEVKRLNNAIQEQKQREEKDAKTIAEQAEKIEKLTKRISEITKGNAKKQEELETAKEDARQTAPQMLEADAFSIIDELEAEKPREEPKIEPKPESQPEPKPEQKPEPEPIAKKDDNLSIYGYQTYTPEPRRRFGDEDFKPRPREDDRPKYVEPEQKPEPEPRDEWREIEESMKKWTKCESEVDKSLMGRGLRLRIDEYEKKNGGEINSEKRELIRKYRVFLSYDPILEAEEALKHAETLRKLDSMNRERELERKRQETAELEKKYEDERGKNVRKEDDTRQNNIKKKQKDELEMGR